MKSIGVVFFTLSFLNAEQRELKPKEVLEIIKSVRSWEEEARKVFPELLPQTPVLDRSLKILSVVDTINDFRVVYDQTSQNNRSDTTEEKIRKTATKILAQKSGFGFDLDQHSKSFTPPSLPRFRCKKEECGGCIEPLKERLLRLEMMLSDTYFAELLLSSQAKLHFFIRKSQIGALAPMSGAQAAMVQSELAARQKLKKAISAAAKLYKYKIDYLLSSVENTLLQISFCQGEKGMDWWGKAQVYYRALLRHYNSTQKRIYNALWKKFDKSVTEF